MQNIIGDSMALFTDIVSRSQLHFPELTVKYKNESLLMKILARILFFNKNFMNITTTLGSTIYFPSSTKVKLSPVSNTVILLHEVSHIYEGKKKNSLLYKFLYLFPQILFLLSIPILVLFGWKLAILCLCFLLPIPAYFRMKEERQAYVISLYVMNRLNNIYNFNIDLNPHKDLFIKEFSNSNYYFMWPLPGIKKSFDDAVEEIKSNHRPIYDRGLYEIIDDILEG